MKRILVLLLMLALLCVSVTAFAEGNTIKFDPKVSVVFEGETLQTVLTRTGVPAEGELTYESANEKIATVDANGIVAGVSKGRVTITAVSRTENKTFRAQLTVTVARKAASVEVDTRKLALLEADDPLLTGLLSEEGENLPVLIVPVKKRVTLQCTVLPKDANNRKAVFTTADDSIASVRGNTVTGMAVGETVLTVASESNPEISIGYRVLVVQPVTRLTLEPRNPVVAKGSQISLIQTVLPEDASIQQIVWSSENENIATVDANGIVSGVTRGNVRIVATALDGSNIRANINVRVTQPAEEITLDKTEMTLDIGRSGVLRGTVLPKNTDDKNVVWTSSDESIATVNRQGRVTGVSLGTCRIICSSASTEGISAEAVVTVQQPVTKIVFDEAPAVFVNENARLSWHVEPENATNPAVTFTSSNQKILTVAEDGTVTGVRNGEAYITATSTDGSNRRARITVKVFVHATGVHMYRHTAYLNAGESDYCRAILEPKEAGDLRMMWRSDDENIAIATQDPNRANRMKITGVTEGITRITGTTVDGGFETSIEVRIGQWDKSAKLTKIEVNGRGDVTIKAKNVSDMNLSTITCIMECYDEGKPVAVNTEDGSNKVKVSYRHMVTPGNSTKDNGWEFENYEKPQNGFDHIIVRIISFQIDKDWVKSIQTRNQPKIEWKR